MNNAWHKHKVALSERNANELPSFTSSTALARLASGDRLLSVMISVLA